MVTAKTMSHPPSFSATPVDGQSFDPSAPGSSAPRRRRGQMALVCQEILTTTVRLRNAQERTVNLRDLRRTFSNQIKSALADGKAVYDKQFVDDAIFAVVAFVDESVMNLDPEAYAEWSPAKLQVQIFDEPDAGVIIFERLDWYLETPLQNDAVADVLEVFTLCLLLGFRGKYAADAPVIKTYIERAKRRIEEIRGTNRVPKPRWAADTPLAPQAHDIWVRRLMWSTLGILAFGMFLFVVYTLVLRLRVPAASAAVVQVTGPIGRVVT
jgi:type VI secretion system protein ImpK